MAAEKAEALKVELVRVEETFFKKIAVDEQDLDMIKARG